MNTKGSVIVLFLCFLTLFTLTDCTTCEKNILEGNSLIFKLTDRQLKDDDQFTIIKDNKVVVRKKNKQQEGPGFVKDNSLELQHVKLSDSGTYNIEVVDVKGTKVKSYPEIVCVYAKVPKPRVNITCQDEKIDFRCDVEGDKDQRSAISYSWLKNGKDLKKNVFNFSINIEEDKSEYTCTAQNPVHKSTSDPVKSCFKRTLFGFDFWFMVALLAGGGGLVLLLIIVLVTIACRSCRRKEKQQRDEEEFRLNYVNTSQSSGPQKSKQTARGQPAPPEPYDEVSAQDVPCQTEPKPRSQQRARPPPPPIDDGEEHPPPLPQPRKKAQVKKREAPL